LCLPQLELLDLSHNRLLSVRQLSFGSLAILNLTGNELAELPQEIGRAKRLSHLYISDNHLTALPSTIGELSNLEILEAQRNRLTNLPPNLGGLTKLFRLDLAENTLTELPDSLRQLSSLSDLNLDGNPNLGLPPEVLTGGRPDDQEGPLAEGLAESDELLNFVEPSGTNRQGFQRLLKHAGVSASELLGVRRSSSVKDRLLLRPKPRDVLEYYFRVRNGRRPLNEAKLILLGRGGVGKTSLVHRLVHGLFDSDQQMTEGIAITNWSIMLYQTETVRLNIWDFGGQEILHATHQFFLTHRALYLVVLNGREGGIDADAEYWLSLVESFGDDSPTLVVLNKITLNPFTVNRRFLKQKFPSICGFVETDCSDGVGIESLRRAIEEATDELPHLRDAFPASWFAIKNELSGSARSYLTFTDYRAICANLGETNANAQDSLASYLHSLGIALN